MAKTTIIALAFVAMVFGTIMLAEPSSAVSREECMNRPHRLCQYWYFKKCCNDYLRGLPWMGAMKWVECCQYCT